MSRQTRRYKMRRIKGAYRPNYRARNCYWDRGMKMAEYCDIKSVALLDADSVEILRTRLPQEYQDYLAICAQYSAIEAARMVYDTLVY